MRLLRRAATLAALLAPAGLTDPAICAPAHIRVILSRKTPPTAALEVVVVARPVGESAEQARQIAVRLPPGEATLDLPSGHWRLHASSPGFWSAEQIRYVGADAATRKQLLLKLFPSGVVDGTIGLAPGGSEQDALGLSASFRTVSTPPPEEGDLRGSVPCTVRGRRFSCEVPAGTVDLRLSARGFMPRYLWGVPLPPSGLRLGELQLPRGASISGFVKTPDGKPASPQCNVRVTTLDGHPLGPMGMKSHHKNAGQDAFVSRVNLGGFFQLGPLPPNAYRVVAADRGLSGTVGVVVHEDSETRLKDYLSLGEPAVLDVAVAPPTLPSGNTWSLGLWSMLTTPASRFLTKGFSLDGHLRVERLSPGDYLVMVEGEGQQWLAQVVRLEPDSGPLQIELPLLKTRGRVTLGRSPIAAHLTFGSQNGGAKIEFASADDGEFQGFLTGPGKWAVEVQAPDPPVTRSLGSVDVTESEVTGEAFVEISLSNASLKGQVVGEDGAPVPGALVSILPKANEPEPVSQTSTDAAGHFELTGFPPGTVLVSAETEDLQTEETRIDIPEGSEKPVEVLLVARRPVKLSGRVISADGAPIPGALFKAVSTDAPLPVNGVAFSRADGEGAFTVRLPAGTRQAELTVGSLGHTLQMMRAPVVGGRAITIALEPAGGDLVLEFVGPWRPEAGSLHAVLFHNGARELVNFLTAFWAVPNGRTPEPTRIALPQMPPGEYTACLMTIDEFKANLLPAPRRCKEGALAPGQELELRLETEEHASGSK